MSLWIVVLLHGMDKPKENKIISSELVLQSFFILFFKEVRVRIRVR